MVQLHFDSALEAGLRGGKKRKEKNPPIGQTNKKHSFRRLSRTAKLVGFHRRKKKKRKKKRKKEAWIDDAE